jgi:hypothetical protein
MIVKKLTVSNVPLPKMAQRPRKEINKVGWNEKYLMPKPDADIKKT